uniref:Uncharacterized protein n=1 Tax=viral metagenome TaxID=1070528 RepID=A0A6C0K1I7_9ZZZZ
MPSFLAKKLQLLDAVRQKNFRQVEALLKEICPELQMKINRDTFLQVSRAVESHIDTIKKKYRSLTINDIKRILQTTGFIPNWRYRKEDYVDCLLRELSRCKNQETMVMGEPIMKLDPKKLYITPSRYCHCIDDLLEYLKSSPYGNTDPLGRHNQSIWTSNSEKKVFLEHPYLPEADLKELKLKIVSERTGQPCSKEFFEAILKLEKLAILILDLPSGQDNARNAELAMSEYITTVLDALTQEDKDKIYNSKTPYGRTVRQIFDYQDICLHVKAYALREICKHILGLVRQLQL